MRSLLYALVGVVFATLHAKGMDAAVPAIAELAGTYYYGDGLGVNSSLQLRPSGSLSYTFSGCLGIYDRNEGKAVVNAGVLHLIASKPNPNERDGVRGMPTKFYAINWDRRIYLISENGFVDFCNAINDGREPRSNPHGLFYLGESQWQQPAKGKPVLPAPYQTFLLRQPVQGKITRLAGKDDAWVNLGSNDGVFRGMKLVVWNESFSIVHVQAVEKNTARIKNDFGDPLTVGENVASQFPR